MKRTLLAFPDPTARLELVTDASGDFMGGVLEQVRNGNREPLAFWSKAFTRNQRQWSTFDRELLACYSSIRHFRHFLDAKDFVLRTDHKPIVRHFHNTSSSLTPRHHRHFDYIAQMTNQVEYVKVESNVADLPSRPIVQPKLNAILPTTSATINFLELAEAQANDSDLMELLSNNTTSLVLKQVPLAEHHTTILCDQSAGRLRPLVPQSWRHKIFQFYHSLSHPGIMASRKLIQRSFVWPDMRRDITKWVRECQQCARAKIVRHNVAPLETVTPPTQGRFTHVYVDITGPLGLSHDYNYLLVIVDRFSRFMNAIPMVGISAQECTDAFIRHWVAWVGCPQHLFTDRGTQFTSSTWKSMCEYFGCQLHHSTAYHSQAQGMVERFNRTLKSSLRCTGNPSLWYDHLPWVLLALRNTPKEDLCHASSCELVFGESMRLPGEFFESKDERLEHTLFANNLAKYIASVRYNSPRQHNRSSYVEKALFLPETAHVYLRIDSHKPLLHPVYKGPFKVLDKREKYFIIDFRTHTDKVTIDRLKSAQLSLDTLNQDALTNSIAMSPSTQPPYTFDRDTYTTYTTRTGRSVRRPIHLTDYTP